MADKEFGKEFRKVLEDTPVNEDFRNALALRLTEMFTINSKYRRPKEQEWVQALRQHKGIYDPDTMSKIPANASKVYPKLTRSKDNMVLSRLNDMLFPDLDRNYTLEPTPVPRISLAAAKAIKDSLTSVDPTTGQKIEPTKDILDKAVIEYCRGTCEKMQKEMDDQLLEMKYHVMVAKPALRSAVIYGTGIVKGPLVEGKKKRIVWEPKGESFIPVEQNVIAPSFEFIPVWTWFPDMNVVDYEDAEGSFQRHVMSKHDLRKLAKMDGFNTKIISEYLATHASGDYTPMAWENDLRAINTITASKNAFESPEAGSTMGIITDRRYQVLEYWGWFDAEDLINAGASMDEGIGPEDEVYANVWILGPHIIKAAKIDPVGGTDVFKIFYYEKDETSIFGTGLPELMRHSQLSIGAAARMMLNHAALCSAPQYEINSSLMLSEDLTDIFGGKIWIREGRGMDAQYPALRVYTIDSHINEYLAIIQAFKQFGDEETTLPTWMISEPTRTTNETAQGISMRQGSVTIALKDIVRNFDDFTESCMGSLYAWNMEFSNKDDIKGDYQVSPKGSTTLVTKEVMMQALNQFVATLTPEDWSYIPRRSLLEQRIKANDLPIELKTEEEAERIRQAQVDMEAMELQKAQMKADVDKTKAMALNFLTKSKKTNKEAMTAIGGGEPSSTKPEPTKVMEPPPPMAEFPAR